MFCSREHLFIWCGQTGCQPGQKQKFYHQAAGKESSSHGAEKYPPALPALRGGMFNDEHPKFSENCCEEV